MPPNHARSAAARKGHETRRRKAAERAEAEAAERAEAARKAENARRAEKAKATRAARKERIAAIVGRITQLSEARKEKNARRAAKGKQTKLKRAKALEREIMDWGRFGPEPGRPAPPPPDAIVGPDWRSEMTYILDEGGTYSEWIKDLVEAIEADAEEAGAVAMATPWRVQGVIEGEESGGQSFDAVANKPTIGERARQILAAILAAAEAANLPKRPSPKKNLFGGTDRPSRASKAANTEAETARLAAIAAYQEQAEAEITQAVRIETLAAPALSPIWGGHTAPPPDDDDDVPF